MRLRRVLNEVQDLRHPDAVIGPQTRSVGREILLRPHQPDGIAPRIIDHTFVGHAHHIHVSLQNRPRHPFITRCRRQISDHIVHIVLHYRTAQPGKCTVQIIADGSLLPRRPGNRRQFFKFRQNALQYLLIPQQKIRSFPVP